MKTIKAVSRLETETKEALGAHRLAIFDYYRVVRNKYSHDKMSEDKVESAFESLTLYKNEIQIDYGSVNAPNNYENISFDDFILFSRVAKDIASRLNDLFTPTDEQIVNYYRRKNLFKELNQNKKRKINALIGHMRSEFGIERSQAKTIVFIGDVPLA